jgi:AcrR family transcriptional regulator
MIYSMHLSSNKTTSRQSSMRYPDHHKSKTREALLEHTAAHVKAQGFASSGVDAIAAAAGVTSGALYKHFSGKEDLFAALVHSQLERTAQRFAVVPAEDGVAAQGALAAYLSGPHVDQPEAGCPLPSLTPEIARSGEAVRQAFQEGLLHVHAQVARLTQSEEKAWSMISQCVGAVMLARAMTDDGTRRKLLQAVRQQASTMLPGRKRARVRHKT